MAKPNLIYKAIKSSWMLDPLTAIAASKVLDNMMGAARLKSKYPVVEYVEDDDDEPASGYYNYRLTHEDYEAIPQGKHINVVRLEGVMMRDEGWCQPGTRDLAEWLRTGDADDRVLANIIIVDSGGGAADSVKDLADAITECNKPVLAFCDGDMCSAAYYTAIYANHIMANDNRNRVGCIGTMIQMEGYPSTSKDEDGYMRLRIYADPSDEKNLEFEQALQGDFKLMKENMLNPLAEDFQKAVKTHRQGAKADQLHGRTYYAQDVVGSLIDSIGSFKDAVNQALDLSTNTITEMKGHENLQSLDTCHDLQMVDGYVSLNGDQLAEIDNAIGELKTEKALNKTHSDTIAKQLTEINELTAENERVKSESAQKDARIDELETKETALTEMTKERDNLKQKNAQKDDRIKELEAALDHDPENDDDPLAAMHNGNHGKQDEFKELTDEESMDYARKVVRGEI